MAFSFVDDTGASVFDIAEGKVVARKTDGSSVTIFENGALVGEGAGYTDAQAKAQGKTAVKEKVTSVTALAGGADAAAIVTAFNSLLTALKA